MNAQPLRPETDELVASAQPWLYRSEAFAEDLSEWHAVADAQDDGAQSLPARLAWPLSALVLGIGLLVGLGL